MFTKEKLEKWIEAITWSLFYRLETDDDAYVLELLNNDKQQQRWEQLQRERGNI